MPSRPLTFEMQLRARGDLAAAYGVSLDGVVGVDGEDRVTFASDRTSSLLGANEEDLIQSVLGQWFEPDDRQDVHRLIERTRSGNPRKKPLKAKTVAGAACRLYAYPYDGTVVVGFESRSPGESAPTLAVADPGSNALLRLAAGLGFADNWPDAMALILAYSSSALGGRAGFVATPDPSGAGLLVAAAWDGGERLTSPNFPAADNWAVRLGRPFVHGLDESGLLCRHVPADAGPVAFDPAFRNGRLVTLAAASVSDSDDPLIGRLAEFNSIVAGPLARLMKDIIR